MSGSWLWRREVGSRARRRHEHDLAASDRFHRPLADLVSHVHEDRSFVAELHRREVAAVSGHGRSEHCRLHWLDHWRVAYVTLAGHAVRRGWGASVGGKQVVLDGGLNVGRRRHRATRELCDVHARRCRHIRNGRGTHDVDDRPRDDAERRDDGQDAGAHSRGSQERRATHRGSLLPGAAATVEGVATSEAVVESPTANPEIVAVIAIASASVSRDRSDRTRSSRSLRTSLSPRSSACRNINVPNRSDSPRISTRNARVPSGPAVAGRVAASCIHTRVRRATSARYDARSALAMTLSLPSNKRGRRARIAESVACISRGFCCADATAARSLASAAVSIVSASRASLRAARYGRTPHTKRRPAPTTVAPPITVRRSRALRVLHFMASPSGRGRSRRVTPWRSRSTAAPRARRS